MDKEANNRKVFIVGLDGGTWSVLTPAVEQGFMPFVKSLIDSGASGILESTLPAITPAAWGSFQTGVNPGTNGVFDFSYFNKKHLSSKYVNSTSLKPTIWEIVSSYGLEVGVINVPMTYPPLKINGSMITGILTPSLDSDFTYPPELKGQLLKAVPDYHIFNLKNIRKGYETKNYDSLMDSLVGIIENRKKAAEFVINKHHLDVFMVHFQATDVLQHIMWGFLNPEHKLFDKDKRRYIFENFFRKLDKHIRSLHDLFEKNNHGEILMLLVSDHGFQSHFKRFNLGNWLNMNGFLKINYPQNKPSLIKRLTRSIGLGGFLKRFIPSHMVDRYERKLIASSSLYCWEKSKVYAMGRSGDGYIYLLEDSEHKRQLTASRIIEELMSIHEPETNVAVIKKVHLRENIFPSSDPNVMPDLLVEPHAGYSITGAILPDEPLFNDVLSGNDFHIGKHHKDGVLIAHGFNVRKQDTIRAHLTDLAPTLLYYLGLPVPANMEGKILKNLFNEEFKILDHQENGVGYRKRLERKQANISKSDEDLITKRLKDLGYM